MKRVIPILVLALGFLFSLNINAQTYISEDFSTFTDSIVPPLASNWKNVDSISPSTNQIWRFDNPNPRAFIAPIAGRAAVLDSDWYGASNSQDAYLVSPTFDATLATTVTLEFDHIHRDLNNTADVEVFDGTNWNIVASYGTVTNNQPNRVVIDISSLVTGVSNAQIRFHYAGSFDWYWIIDNVEVFQPVPDDLAALSVDSLISGCNLDSIPVSTTVVNVGSSTINSFDLNYTVNGANTVTENISTPLLSGDTLRYTFNKQANVATLGSYQIQVYTFTRNDINNTNDSATGNVTNLNVVNTFPYVEGFESSNGDWLSGGVNSSWQHGVPAGTIINSAASGTQAYVTNLTGDYNDDEDSYVISPCFDFSGLTQPQIKVDIWVESEDGFDGTILQSTIDGGLSWQTVGALNDPVNWYNSTAGAIGNATSSNSCWTDNSPFAPPAGWVLAERDLTGLGGQPSVRLRFFHATDGSVREEGFAFDNILIQEAPSTDAAMAEIVRPTTGCALGSTDSVEVRINNPGSSPISNFGVSYVLNAGIPVNETFTGTINPGDTVNYVFTASVNLSTLGNYSLQAYTSLIGDANALNDTLNYNFNNIPVVNTFPYNQGFETGNGGWVSGGTANSWQLGTPAGAIINTAAAGTQAWVTNLTGVYNDNEVSYVESPCFDFSSVSLPRIIFSLWLDNESGYDGTILESSIDGGLSWQKVGAINDPINWYNDLTFTMGVESSNSDCWSGASPFTPSPGWVVAEHALTGLGGQPSVKLRFLHVTDGSFTDEGFGFDEILIQDAPSTDAAVSLITSPVGGCGLGTADSVRINIVNNGSNQLDTVPVNYTVNFTGLVNDTSFTTIMPGDTLSFTFNTTVNLSTPGNYFIDAFSTLQGDFDSSNDTALATVVSEATVSFPYFEDFESSNGGWTVTGSNPSWAWGVPAAPYISNAGNGINSWVTNLSGNYNDNEDSFIESPCIDMTNLTSDPRLEFLHAYATEPCCDEGWLELSTDGGQNWSKLPSSSTSVNWYNDTVNQWWDDSSAVGSGTWQIASNDLLGAAGNIVKVRFALASDGSITFDGFGIDSVSIDLSIGLDQSTINDQLSIFPNPSEGQFILRSELGEAYDVLILSSNGRVVYDRRLSFNTSRDYMIDLSDQSKGLYFIRLMNGEEMVTKKVIIQ